MRKRCASDAQVLEHVASRNDPITQELRRLRTQLASAPTSLELATRLSRRYIDLARRKSDPRYLGYAQAALDAWWDREQVPAEVRILRATLWQSTHQFGKALTELDAVLKTHRHDEQAAQA